MQHPPFAHQTEALEKCKDRTEFALYAEMGTGKTFIALAWAERLFKEGKIDGILVIGLNGMFRNWLREAPMLLDKDIADRILMAPLKTTNKKADGEAVVRVVSDYDQDKGRFRMLCTNVEGLISTSNMTTIQRYMKTHRIMAMVDESTSIKSPKASRTKAAIEIAKKAHYRLIMTGTPTPQSPLDVFAPSQFLKPGLLKPDNYFAFEKRHAIFKKIEMGQRSFNKVVGFKNLDSLKEQMEPWTFRVLKEDCLDLPEKTYIELPHEMDAKQERAYKLMKTDFIAPMDNGDVVAANGVMSQMHKLQQIACGYLLDDDGNISIINPARFDTVHDIVASAGGPVIVWAPYRFALAHLAEILGKDFRVAQFWGGVPDADRQAGLAAWHNREIDVLVANPQTAGYGLTLTESSTMVFFANNFSLEQRLQAEDRAHRIGQHHPVTIYDLTTTGTIDQRVVSALRRKHNIQSEIMSDPARGWLEYS